MGNKQRVRKIRTKPKPVRFHVRDKDGSVFVLADGPGRLYAGTGFRGNAAVELWRRIGRELGYRVDGSARQTFPQSYNDWTNSPTRAVVSVGHLVRVRQAFGVTTDLVVAEFTEGRVYVLDDTGKMWDASRHSDLEYRIIGNGYCLRGHDDNGVAAYVLSNGDFKVGCTRVRRAKMLRIWKRLAQWAGYELVK